MKHRIKILLLAGTLLFLTACSVQDGETSGASGSQGTQSSQGMQSSQQEQPESSSASDEAYHKITAEEAKKMMDEGGVTVVDVRTQQEYEERHIPNAVLVPNETISDTPPQQLQDKDAVLLVYCRTGVRSKQASEKLVSMGYTKVYDMGGIVDWSYDTVSGSEQA
ncbi:rhodanese-like domain-containing protein [Candidatus Soleaferrea massiliensis]|uniref:rhodanese-like domain-containing protein n=1 Tax=Candidatus Soleaferrea massiliensis TaxID=1470354 RepID=UPI0009E32AFB